MKPKSEDVKFGIGKEYMMSVGPIKVGKASPTSKNLSAATKSPSPAASPDGYKSQSILKSQDLHNWDPLHLKSDAAI